ncbi:MAG: hypothetical protein KY475_22500 [Planctomycetes bacterium]|nr:hypothetical protein [Planctomycetota bacterium]
MTAASHANPLESWRPPSRGVAGFSLAAGAVLLIVCFAAGLLLFSLETFFQAYLFGFLFWWVASMGCVGLALLHNLTGGHWGNSIRPFLHAGMGTILLAAVLFVPLAFGIGRLYEWAHQDAAADPILAPKLAYLNTPFFLARAALYFVLWLIAAAIARRGARRASALSLAVVILAVSFASIDWAMSLDPHWYSTMYGALYVAGAAVAAMALSVAFLAALAPSRAAEDRRAADVFNDLGNLLLAFIMVWAYFSFSQFLIIWSGNLPEEATWYLDRSQHGWQWVIVLVALLHFALPFLLLLSRDVKRNPRIILLVAGGLLVMRMLDLLWVVAPSFHGHGWSGILLDVAAWLGIGGVWLGVFCWRLTPPAPESHRHRGKHGKKKG